MATAPGFPPDFVFGAATAAYQIEGSPLADGAAPSIWHRFSHTAGNIAGGDTGDVACDHYRRWDEDVDLMRSLGLQAYRFSIAWPRVIPEGTGTVNVAGLDFYDRLVDALLAAGIQPFVTLYHWDLPGALQDRGGWVARPIADAFGEYADVVARRLGDRVAGWITLNEPAVTTHSGHVIGRSAPGLRDMWSGLRAAYNQLRAHGAAVQALRATVGDVPVGIALNLSGYEPARDTAADRAAVERALDYDARLYLDAIYRGSVPRTLTERFGAAMPELSAADLALMQEPIDFLGVNHYTTFALADAPGNGVYEAEIGAVGAATTEMGWGIHPPGFGRLLDWLTAEYGRPPIYISENGGAFPDVVGEDGTVHDGDRIDYLREHLLQVGAAAERGVDVRGYFAWSLLDNFEWTSGYSKRFGIVHVDYATQKRTVKASGHWYAEVIGRRAVPC